LVPQSVKRIYLLASFSGGCCFLEYCLGKFGRCGTFLFRGYLAFSVRGLFMLFSRISCHSCPRPSPSCSFFRGVRDSAPLDGTVLVPVTPVHPPRFPEGKWWFFVSIWSSNGSMLVLLIRSHCRRLKRVPFPPLNSRWTASTRECRLRVLVVVFFF